MAAHVFLVLLVSVMALYAFMMVSITTGLLRSLSRWKPGRQGTEATVTVILPVRNEAMHIGRILNELAGQDFPAGRLEVIVADDHSDDGTPEIVEDFARQHPERPVTLLRAGSGDRPGKKAAIARATQQAKGNILLFTDGDTFRGPGWVTSMTTPFGDPGTHLVAGPVAFCNERNLLMRLQTQEFQGIMGTTAGSAALGLPLMCNGANLACRRLAFDAVNGHLHGARFSSGDDQFLLGAIRRRFGGKSILFHTNPSATVQTEPQSTLSGFLHQRLRWVGKSRGYRDPIVIAAGAVTGLANLLLFAGFAAGIFVPAILPAIAILWVSKMLLEWPVTGAISRFFGKPALSVYYLPAQLFQLIYVPFVAVFGLFLPFRWKGRLGRR